MQDLSTEPTHSPASLRTCLKPILVVSLSTLIVYGSRLMIGPQIVFIVPFSILCAVVFAVKRSCWSLVFFGYPMTFGLVSAWIGYSEISGYWKTTSFAISMSFGLLACAMIVLGLWKALLREQT